MRLWYLERLLDLSTLLQWLDRRLLAYANVQLGKVLAAKHEDFLSAGRDD
jgi:hypothetical protein